MDQLYSVTIITMKGQEYECKYVLRKIDEIKNSMNNVFLLLRSTTGKVEGSEMPSWGLVRDGTSCGDNLVRYFFISHYWKPSIRNNLIDRPNETFWKLARQTVLSVGGMKSTVRLIERYHKSIYAKCLNLAKNEPITTRANKTLFIFNFEILREIKTALTGLFEASF